MKLTKRLALLGFILVLAEISFAQNHFTGYVMPSAKLKYTLNKKIKQSIGIENRNFYYHNNNYEFKLKHIELINFTMFEFVPHHFINFGISYRMEEDSNKENELRLTQQYEWQNNEESLLKHRIQIDERFYSSHTKYRLRYQSSLNIATKTFLKNLTLNNELVTELSSQEKPVYEERIAFLENWKLGNHSKLVVGPQYRLTDFTRTSKHALFLTAGLSVSI